MECRYRRGRARAVEERAAELVGRETLAGGRLHERRAAEEHVPDALRVHHLRRHHRQVRAACRTTAAHDSYLQTRTVCKERRDWK